MGLDISYYAGLVPAKDNEAFDRTGEPKYSEGWVVFYSNPDFPGWVGSIVDGVAYKADNSGGFRAGSYSGYNQWRESLAELASYSPIEIERYGVSNIRHDAAAWAAESGPFWELINFSDCEGTIGPEMSAKLAKDFADYQGKADAHHFGPFRESYAEWRIAFETAAQNGAVNFR